MTTDHPNTTDKDVLPPVILDDRQLQGAYGENIGYTRVRNGRGVETKLHVDKSEHSVALTMIGTLTGYLYAPPSMRNIFQDV